MCTSVPQERWSSAHRDYISLLLLFFFLISNILFISESLKKKKIRLKGFLRHSAEHSKCRGREWEQGAFTAFGNEAQSRRSPHLHPLHWCRKKVQSSEFQPNAPVGLLWTKGSSTGVCIMPVSAFGGDVTGGQHSCTSGSSGSGEVKGTFWVI